MAFRSKYDIIYTYRKDVCNMIKKFLIENPYAKNFNQMVEALKAEHKAISEKQGYYDRTETTNSSCF